MFWSQYLAFNCDSCGGRFYIDNGDPTDLTAEDTQGAKCPWCGAFEDLCDDPDCDHGDEESCDVGLKSLPEYGPRG